MTFSLYFPGHNGIHACNTLIREMAITFFLRCPFIISQVLLINYKESNLLIEIRRNYTVSVIGIKYPLNIGLAVHMNTVPDVELQTQGHQHLLYTLRHLVLQAATNKIARS